MALQLDYYDNRLEVTKTDCYWKIALEEGIWGGKELLNGRLLCYKDQTTADTNSSEYKWKDFQFVPDMESTDNFIKQAYNYLKTLPEFSAAIDV